MLKDTHIFLKSSLNLLLQAPSKRVIRNFSEKKIDSKLFSISYIKRDTKPKIDAKKILFMAKNFIDILDFIYTLHNQQYILNPYIFPKLFSQL